MDYSSISAAIAHGDRLDELRAIHRRLAKVLDDPKTLARDIASVSRRQLEVSREIAELVAEQEAAEEVEVSNENVVDAESTFRPEAI
ncbi:hypothetical protein [Brevibacterium sp. SMBL_HHYL_HB1]|uniref:hypothetical protein n=1 Tax=Brevibacterium sp. SMBL_HHYL_HB1 TaxID=2777556 RepID=UPI001BA6E3E5|nr:hypothetical protein [Brevibacterium sp. SMBL_HHYL_HB1]QUL79917.1 hypothetical protein IG171_03470 [Brevibacterium sp. SMBL_HHYL_HB1]